MPSLGSRSGASDPAASERRASVDAAAGQAPRPRDADAPAAAARRVAVRLLTGFTALALITWGAGELWLTLAGSAELEFMQDVVAARSDVLSALARTVTWAGSALLLVPLALTLAFVLDRTGHRREALFVLLCLGGAMLLSDLVKPLVSRPRPPVEHLQKVTGSSFPSGHATQASAFWFSLIVVLRALGGSARASLLACAAAAILVASVAASRVYLGVHYPSDVVAGVILGGAWVIVVRTCVPDRARGRPGGVAFAPPTHQSAAD